MKLGPLARSDCLPQVFIVRVWREASAPGQDRQWRGSVEHATTHEKRYFREVEALAEFIRRQVDWPDHRPAQGGDAR